MNKYFACILSLILAGCVSMSEKSIPADPVLLKKSSLTKIDMVKVGMAYKEVLAIMDSSVKVGYQQSDQGSMVFEPINLKQPTRAEILTGQGKNYEVLYYFTDINKADGMIVDDELTPLIFQDQKLIGKGWDFLFYLRKDMS